MRVLVTGAAGFIGQHLCRELRAHNHDVVAVDKHNGDLRYPGTIYRFLEEEQPDVVVHLAAKVGRMFGEDNLGETITDNATMTANVARACGDNHVKMVYASTSEVYGDRGNEECHENHLYTPPRLPHNLYGLSKKWGEEACRLYAPRALLIWRISMPYGPGLPAGTGRAAIINFLYNALHGLPITVHRDSERSWCWIGDTVRGMRLTIEQNQRGAFNIGRDDNPVSMNEIACRALAYTGGDSSLIQYVDPPARQTLVKRLSTRKLRSLGWQPEVELAEGMERTLEWVKTLPAPKTTALAA